MKKKLFIVLMLAVFAAFLSAAQGQQVSKSNAPAGIPSFYQNQLGTTVGNSRAPMDALVYVEWVMENDFVVTALVNLGYTVTLATSWPDFDTKLATGNYGLAVGANQNYYTLPTPQVVQTYINNGGCMIFDDWTMDATLAALFEASYTGNINGTQLNITDPGLANGVSNPLPLVNPGWGTFSMGLSATGGGQVLATFPNGDAAVVRGNGGRTIILGYLTDTPTSAERQQLFENVVNATICGGLSPVPISNWALYIGIFLIITFAVIRFRKMI